MLKYGFLLPALFFFAGFDCEAQKAVIAPGKRGFSSGNGCVFGVEGSAPVDPAEQAAYLAAIRRLGAQFIVCQFAPERNTPLAKKADNYVLEGTSGGFSKFAQACRGAGLAYVANQEVTNYSVPGTFLDKQGKDILSHSDGTHRWDVSGTLLGAAARLPEFRGVIYDESEHGQMRRDRNTNNLGKSDGLAHPYYAATDGLSLDAAYEAVYGKAKALVEEYRKAGVPMFSEHVFPVMLHALARAGVNPAIKFMKEGHNSVYAAVAIGAAKQYGVEFCVNPDLWGVSGFPGHPPEELRCSLLFAYWMGASRVFVENAYVDFMDKPVPGLLDRTGTGASVRYSPTEYGKIYEWFVKEYVPKHPRPYSFQDIRPDIAIVRFPDSCWGQKGSWLPDALYGASNLPTAPENAAWIGIWRGLTFDAVRPSGLSWHSPGYANVPHDFFCPLNNAVVYDHLATADDLKGVKLVFLTGAKVSDGTLAAVREFVRQGGLCVSLPSLAPSGLTPRSGVVPDGSGKWLLTSDFYTEEVGAFIGVLRGRSDEIRYRFGSSLMIVRRQGNDGNSIRIYVQDVSNENAEPEESARVW